MRPSPRRARCLHSGHLTLTRPKRSKASRWASVRARHGRESARPEGRVHTSGVGTPIGAPAGRMAALTRETASSCPVSTSAAAAFPTQLPSLRDARQAKTLRRGFRTGPSCAVLARYTSARGDAISNGPPELPRLEPALGGHRMAFSSVLRLPRVSPWPHLARPPATHQTPPIGPPGCRPGCAPGERHRAGHCAHPRRPGGQRLDWRLAGDPEMGSRGRGRAEASSRERIPILTAFFARETS